jgi:hypothetical protein
MKRMLKVGIASVVAILVLGAVTSASALAALPEFSTRNGAKYIVTQSGEGTLSTAKSGSIKCKNGSGTGEVTGAKTATAKVNFKECKESVFNTACKTTGAGANEIQSVLLKGTLYYIKATTPIEVGIELSPNAGAEFTNGEISCDGGFVKTKVTGCVTASLTQPAGYNLFVKKGEHDTLKFEAAHTGSCGGLTAFGEAATLTATDLLEPEGTSEIEVKA